MEQFSFTLEIVGLNPANDRYEDALYEAGCDDALVAVIDGRVMLDFDREDVSYEAALSSALRDVARVDGLTAMGVLRDGRH